MGRIPRDPPATGGTPASYNVSMNTNIKPKSDKLNHTPQEGNATLTQPRQEGRDSPSSNVSMNTNIKPKSDKPNPTPQKGNATWTQPRQEGRDRPSGGNPRDPPATGGERERPQV